MRFGDLGRIVLFLLCVSVSSIAQPAGVVRDGDGKPVAGAKLMLYSHQTEWGLDNEVIETVQSGGDVAYHFTKKLQFKFPSGTTYNDYYIITASHPSYAFGWAVIVASEQRSNYDIVLTKPRKQTFVVKDENDNPVKGATVWINGAGDSEDAQASFRTHLTLPTDIHLASAMTDAEGRATVTNLPMTQLYFQASFKGYGNSWKDVSKPSTKDVELKLWPAGVVRGTVRNEDGEAVGGAVVAFSANWMNGYTLVRTNSDGQFEANQLVARGGSWANHGGDGTYKVSIRHPDYCAQVMTVTLNPGQTIDNFDITAEKGSILRVKVTDPETHDPVGGVHVRVRVRDQDLEGYTDQKGRIELRALPGQSTIFITNSPAGTYLLGDFPTKPITVAGDETEATIEPPTPFKPTVNVRGRIVDADGKPGRDAIVRVICGVGRVLCPEQFGFSAEVVTDDQGEYVIRGFPGSTPMFVYVETRDRKFAAKGSYELRSTGDDLRQPIKLAATQTADVDLDGLSRKHQSHRSMQITPMVGGYQIPQSTRTVETDEHGHLKLDGIVPGTYYTIEEDAKFHESNGTEDLFRRNVEIIPAP